jgi:hypothetical protein
MISSPTQPKPGTKKKKAKTKKPESDTESQAEPQAEPEFHLQPPYSHYT